MPFSISFQLYSGGQYTYPCFPEIRFTSTLHNILSHITIFETMDSGERGMNPVGMMTEKPLHGTV